MSVSSPSKPRSRSVSAARRPASEAPTIAIRRSIGARHSSIEIAPVGHPFTAAFTFARKGDATAALTVSYTVGGTATNGIDYVLLAGSVTFPAKKKTAKVTLQIVDDASHEGTESIDIAIAPGADYTESLASTARIDIIDND